MLSAIETTDIYRGAYLLCCGALVRETRVLRGQVHLLIEGEGVIEHDTRYRAGCALVNPVALREALNCLRDLVFDALRPETARPETERGRDHGTHPRSRDRATQAASQSR